MGPEEGNDPLGSIVVHIRKINLITEHDQPHSKLNWRQHHSIGCFSILTIMIQCFEKQLWSCCRAEIKANHFHVWQRTEGREESHGFTYTILMLLIESRF